MGNVYPNDDANSNIVSRIGEKIQSFNNNISIMQLGMISDVKELSAVQKGKIKVYSFGDPLFLSMSNSLKVYLQSIHVNNTKQRIFALAKRPRYILEYIIKRIVFGNYVQAYKNNIIKICKIESIDLIVCVSYPFRTCLATSKVNNTIPYIYYQLDPHTTHYQQKSKCLAKIHEHSVCKKAKHIFMTDLIYDEYKMSSFKRYISKSTILNFPGIRYIGQETVLINKRNEENDLVPIRDGYTFIYIGSLYEDIRSPEYCLSFFCKLSERLPSFSLYFVGPIYGDLSNTINKYKKILGGKVKFIDKVTSVEADHLLLQADFLVNIGNTIHNQMPSKLFDYISTGKPMLNFFKLEHCPTLKYTMVYPNCLNIAEYHQVTEDLLDRTIDFCDNASRKVLSIKQVMELFPEYTVEAVSEEFQKQLNAL